MSGRVLLLALAGTVLLTAPPPAQAVDPLACFPSCQPDDGRFLVASSDGLSSFGGVPIKVRFEPRERGEPFVIEVFDGDMRRGPGANFWDYGNVYNGETRTLWALTPCLDDRCAALAPPIATATCADLPDNGWYAFDVPGDDRYPAYVLSAEIEDPTVWALNQFKLRTTGRLLLTRDEQPFAFEAGLLSALDILTVFPAMDPLDWGRGDLAKVERNMIGARYDGTFRFPFEVTDACTGGDDDEVGYRTLELWDGDLDRGGYDGAPLDTDDPDTPPTEPPFCSKLSPHARAQINPEGVALGMGLGMGAPPDEMDPSANDWLNRYICRPPSVQVTVFSPDGEVFVNDNPSGNQEWERYCISEDPLLAADAHVDRLANGLWWVEVSGMDHCNLNAWYTDCTVLGLSPGGCTPGYWKQRHHFDSWGPRFAPDDLFSDVFGVGPPISLRAALSKGGGGSAALGRHAVAALLNAASPAVDYHYAEAEVIAAVQEAYRLGQFEAAKDLLAPANERGCPLD